MHCRNRFPCSERLDDVRILHAKSKGLLQSDVCLLGRCSISETGRIRLHVIHAVRGKTRSVSIRSRSSRQEGWRLEHEKTDDPTSPIVIKGVVFNEMKGVFVSDNARFLSLASLLIVYLDYRVIVIRSMLVGYRIIWCLIQRINTNRAAIQKRFPRWHGEDWNSFTLRITIQPMAGNRQIPAFLRQANFDSL